MEYERKKKRTELKNETNENSVEKKRNRKQVNQLKWINRNCKDYSYYVLDNGRASSIAVCIRYEH